MQKILSFIYIGAWILTPLANNFFTAVAANEMPQLVISEVQTGGLTNDGVELPAAEFVELKNTTDHIISLNNVKVEYLFGNGNIDRTLGILSGNIEPQGYVLMAHNFLKTDTNMMADFYFGTGMTSVFGKTIGQIRLVNNDNETIDWVAWGNATLPVGWPKTTAILPGYSIKRILPGDDLYGSGAIFTTSTLPLTPQGGGYTPYPVLPADETEDVTPSEEPSGGGLGGDPGVNSCAGIVISEILPNPSGADNGNEYIEIYNPSGSNLSLEGCKLSTSANSKVYVLGGISLSPGQYLAVYNDISGLTLENSAGGSVFLIDVNDTEINQVDYPSSLDDDVSWSLIGGVWAQTFSMTPNAQNILLSSKPCGEGKIRNPDTDKCMNMIASASTLTGCKTGQERNPATNRCRNIVSFTSTLKSCEAGQVRNPETNRCRKIDSPALTPCKAGQERNAETNRCRNISAVSSDEATDVKDVLSAASADKTNWFLAGFTIIAAALYAVWEWRNEISQMLLSLRAKLPTAKVG